MEKLYTKQEVEAAMIAADRAAIADVVQLLRRSALVDCQRDEEARALGLMADAIEGQPRGPEDIKRAIERWVGAYPVM